jgi:general secretion pathway protein G
MIQPDSPPVLDLESLVMPGQASTAPAPLTHPVVEPQIVQPEIVHPEIVQPSSIQSGSMGPPMAASEPTVVDPSQRSAGGKKKTLVYMAAGAGGVLLLLVVFLLVTGGDSGSADAFGRRALAAIQAKDPEQLCEFYAKYEDIQWMLERFRSAIDDPLKKARFEEAIGNRFDEEGMTRYNDDWRKGVMRFLTFIENGEAELTFEQLGNATYLGLVGEVPRRTFEEEFGVSHEDAGVIIIGEPEIFIGVQGRVYVINLNYALSYLNGHWRVSGDWGLGLRLAFDQPIDLDEVKFERVAPGAPAGREVLERVNQYLRDSQGVRQGQESGIFANSKVKTASAQMMLFKTPLDTYQLHLGHYPATEVGLQGLREPPSDALGQQKWSGPYLRREIPADPWNGAYQYELMTDPANGAPAYRIWSSGPSGQSNGDPPDGDDVSVYSYERPANLAALPGPSRVEIPRGDNNLPDRREIVDLNDLERGTGTSGPGTSTPEPEKADKPSWINDAPVFSATILQAILRHTRTIIKEWDNQPENLEDADRRRLDEGFYGTLAQMGLAATFRDEKDPEAQAVVDEMVQLLFTFGNNEKKLDLITEHGQFTYNLAREGLRRIALYGTITAIEQKDRYFETTLKVKTEEESTDVIVISRVDSFSPLKPGQQVLILGVSILNPVENVNGYRGDAKQLVIGGCLVVLKQPGGADGKRQDEDAADPGSDDGSLPE